MANVSYDPYVTTVATGSFNAQSTGVIQGDALDDPAINNALAGGYVASTETLPMWGGVAISEQIGIIPGAGFRGNALTRAAAVADITGFTVFNQAHHGITYPGSPVPTFGNGMSVHFYRLGSGIRIPLKASPTLIDDAGNLITNQFSYDFGADHVIPYNEASTTVDADAVYASGVVTVTAASAHGLAVGDYVTMSGFVPDGYNGTVLVTSIPSTTTFTYDLAADPGAQTTSGSVTLSGGLLPIRVLTVVQSGAKVVQWDAENNVAVWNTPGDGDSVAVIALI